MATAALGMQKLLQVGTKIVGVGRNYAAHAKELGNAVPKEPVLFLKPTSSYLDNGGTILIPHPLESLHHEVELAVVIGKKARDVPEASAMDYIGGLMRVPFRLCEIRSLVYGERDWDHMRYCFLSGYALALDMTAREIQASAKSAGLPWTVAKGQDTFTPISSIPNDLFANQNDLFAMNFVQLPKSAVPDPDNLELWLKVDDEIRQKGPTKDMIFKIPFLISYISAIMTLFEGDVILTGTPPGVSPVKAGQKVTAGITGLVDVQFNCEKRKRPGN
ncbi:unnamed protein product [Linum tenue]|uniref:Fumarylacetoacetase-like C-terminal domain-containing protein n=1 Tax=Linum tenue TaxID=586396 RepID=A0AAV0P8I0_9ROSI|nr:unnamed protein product [Linum tenue]